MQKVDYLLRLMKQRTDALIASDEKLQQFLMWVNEKSLSVEVPYKPAAVRAYYFAIEPARHPGRQSAFDRILERAVERTLDPAFEADRDPAFESRLIRTLDPAFDSALVPPVLDLEIGRALQELKEQLPDRDRGKEIYNQWWKANGHAWTRQLREITISHRNNSQNWQFSEQQRKQLQQYYKANQLLVLCLNRSCNVTPAVQEEIEETLFLPIAEIEKRLTEMLPNAEG